MSGRHPFSELTKECTVAITNFSDADNGEDL